MLSIQKPNFVSFTGNKSNKSNKKNSNTPAKFTPEQAQAEINELKNKLKETKISKIKNRISNAIITIMIAGGVVSAPKVISVFNDKNKDESKKHNTEMVLQEQHDKDSIQKEEDSIYQEALKDLPDDIGATEVQTKTTHKKTKTVHKKNITPKNETPSITNKAPQTEEEKEREENRKDIYEGLGNHVYQIYPLK